MCSSGIKAIETRYKGYRFRSRLEARWAVFLDAMGVDWEYEPEGYETPEGWYLPDFLFTRGIRGPWLEVKAVAPTEAEVAKLCAVCEHTNSYGAIVIGQPDFIVDETVWGAEWVSVHKDGFRDGNEGAKPLWDNSWWDAGVCFPGSRWPVQEVVTTHWNIAVQEMRSARFEHGEFPSPPRWLAETP